MLFRSPKPQTPNPKPQTPKDKKSIIVNNDMSRKLYKKYWLELIKQAIKRLMEATNSKKDISKRTPKSDLVNYIKQLESRIDSLETQLSQKDQELKEAKDLINKKDQELKKKDEEIKRLDAKVKSLEEKLKVKDAKLNEMDTQLKVKDAKLNEMDTQLKEMDTKLKEMDTRLKEKDEELIAKTNELETIRDESKLMKKEIKILQEAVFGKNPEMSLFKFINPKRSNRALLSTRTTSAKDPNQTTLDHFLGKRSAPDINCFHEESSHSQGNSKDSREKFVRVSPSALSENSLIRYAQTSSRRNDHLGHELIRDVDSAGSNGSDNNRRGLIFGPYLDEFEQLAFQQDNPNEQNPNQHNLNEPNPDGPNLNQQNLNGPNPNHQNPN